MTPSQKKLAANGMDAHIAATICYGRAPIVKLSDNEIN
jgi:hypothetical protein